MDPTFLILIAVFALMMWMMSRGAKKQRQAAQELRSNLQVGQQVMTASGFYGTIVDIDGDVITIETTPGTEIMTARNFIAGITEPPFAVDTDDDAETEESHEDGVADIAVPDDASSLTEQPADPTTDEPADRPGDENDERRA